MPHLIVFSHLRWDFVYQRPQHLLSRLAQRFPVLFIEEPIRHEGPARLDVREAAEQVTVIRPFTSVEAFGFHDDQLSVLKPLLGDHLKAQGIDDYVVWFYTPMALPLLSELQPRAVVYDCMDELSAFKNAPLQMRQRESALMKAAQIVLTGGLSLYEAKRELHPNVHCLPSAVDAKHFSPSSLQDSGEGAELASRLHQGVPHPRLGFYGVIDERIDLNLVAAVADSHPDWHLMMVGPVVKIDPASLPQRPNIHWLGMQKYEHLPYLVAEWDLCLMPFALNDSTKFISPTKTLEYMAAEKAVVSTPVKDVVALYGDVVRVGHNNAEFIEQCQAALEESEAERALRVGDMLSCVSRFSWNQTATVIESLIDEQLKRDAAPQEVEASDLPQPPAVVSPLVKPSSAHGRNARPLRNLVIGAGPTGLAAAYHLSQQGAADETLLIEREDRVGGCSRSFTLEGFTFDVAGHIPSATDESVQPLYQALLGQNLRWQEREAWIYRNGAYTRYPFQSFLYDAPAELLGECMFADAPARFGYPLEGGSQALMDAFVPHLRCEVALKTGVVHLSPRERTALLDDGRTIQFDTLISTIPLPQLVAACGDEAPLSIQAAARALQYVSARYVHLAVNRADLTDKHWIHYPEGVVFQSVFAPGNASPGMHPPGGFGLTCEVRHHADLPLPCDGQALIDRVVADCRKVGLLREDDQVIAATQGDVPYAHVVYTHDRAAHVALIREWLASFGVVLAGRYSEWAYYSTDHPFVAGQRAAEKVLHDAAPRPQHASAG